ncbi:MAG: signal peptidase II [Melioribacteraceae bacterium]|nr:signal peptidase II [Melioribacteraceae bacterium]MCF8265158.1 signal peptidase II [Melioribacteraceae bacterium]MCF8432676.1 signal peptidase II [Melioribacteraceae bacterium]
MKVLYLSLFIVLSDQATKLLIKGFSIPFLGFEYTGMDYASSINIIGDFFKFTFVENPGMAFGIDVGIEAKLLLSIFSLIASIGIFYYLYQSRDQHIGFRIALALILGGAVGNLIDRSLYGVFYGYAPLFYGRVVDFLNVEFFDFTIFGKTFDRWPIFNIADSAVTIGVVILLFFNHSNHKKNDAATENEEKIDKLEMEASPVEEPQNQTEDNVEDNYREKNSSDDNGREEERKT